MSFTLQGPSWWSTPRSILGASGLSSSCCRSVRMTPTASSSATSCTAVTATAPGTCRSTSGSTGAPRAVQCGISQAPRGTSGTKWSSLSALSGPVNTRWVPLGHYRLCVHFCNSVEMYSFSDNPFSCFSTSDGALHEFSIVLLHFKFYSCHVHTLLLHTLLDSPGCSGRRRPNETCK